MPAWIGKWKGGRFYLDEEGRRVFVIEAMRGGQRYTVKLDTHDEELAVGELVRFNQDPGAFTTGPVVRASTILEPVLITKERLALYLESIHATVKDHRAARFSQLTDWAEHKLDLRTADRKTLRTALAKFDGGHRGRVEALNAFARFLVKEGDLPSWNPLVNHRAAAETRAEREAYALEQLAETYKRLDPGPIRDVFHLRVATGMHHTELEQLAGAKLTAGPLPDRGAWVRELPPLPPEKKGQKAKPHQIAGVLQVVHRKKSKVDRRHRVSVDRATLDAALRLREGVPGRITVWKALEPLVPSNLRHTFITLSGEVGELVTYKAPGVDRARIQQIVGHRTGSTMTSDRYDKLQVPPMIKLPLPW